MAGQAPTLSHAHSFEACLSPQQSVLCPAGHRQCGNSNCTALPNPGQIVHDITIDTPAVAVVSDSVLLLTAGLFDNVLSDYLWARAVLLIGPTIATVGLSVQIPLAVVAEMLLRSPPWLRSPSSAVLILVGALAVIAGFLGVTLTGQTTSSDAVQPDTPIGSEPIDREPVPLNDETVLP